MVYPNLCDPRVLSLVLGTGERFSLLGCKSDSGKITSAHELIFFDGEEISTVEFIPESNTLVGIGGQVQMSVCSQPGSWRIGLLAGSQQLELNIGDPLVVTLPPAPAQGPAGSASLRAGQHLKLTMQAQDCPACAGVASLAQAQAVNAPIAEIAVSGCVGAHPNVFVYMRDETGKLLDAPAKAVPAGGNRYNAVLTTLNTPDDAFNAAAKEAQAFLNEFDITEGAFSSMLIKLKSTSLDVMRDEIVDYLKSQNKFGDTYEQFAEFLGASDGDVTEMQKTATFKVFLEKALGTIFKAVDFYERMKQALQDGLALNSWLNAYSQYKYNQLQLQAVVKTENGQEFVGVGSGLVPPEGPYPVLSVTADGTASISKLTLDPSIPPAGQAYVASGTISCLLQGDQVTLSVAGSDGYTDSICETASGHGRQDFSLGVPGAAEGVHDVVTMMVQRNGAQIAACTASLVFA